MKFKLDLDDLSDDFFEETRLVGIVAPIKDYQLCWQINQVLRFDFRNNTELEIQLTKKQRRYFFAVFEYREPNSSLVHYIYNNHHDGEYLLPEFKHLDFLWLMKGDVVGDEKLNNFLGAARNIAAVQLVTELTNEKIRNKGHLIF